MPSFVRIRHSSLAIISAIVLCSLFLPGCTYLFFRPTSQLMSDPVTREYAPEDVHFKSPDGLTLNGWYFKARSEQRGTILVCHGNAENLSTHVKLDLWLIDAGYNLFIFD